MELIKELLATRDKKISFFNLMSKNVIGANRLARPIISLIERLLEDDSISPASIPIEIIKELLDRLHTAKLDMHYLLSAARIIKVIHSVNIYDEVTVWIRDVGSMHHFPKIRQVFIAVDTTVATVENNTLDTNSFSI